MKIISRKLMPVEQKAYPRFHTYVKHTCEAQSIVVLTSMYVCKTAKEPEDQTNKQTHFFMK